MFVYLFVVVVDVDFWLRPLLVVPVGRGSFTSGRPAVATATKHSSRNEWWRAARGLPLPKRRTGPQLLTLLLPGTHAPQGGGECGWQVVKKEEEGGVSQKREGGGEVGVQHRQL